jgi:hypothetical protein
LPPRQEFTDRSIAASVLRYFLRNPQVVDSIEGVARWRLLEEAIERTVAQTEAAVGWLEAKGFLRRVNKVGSRSQMFGLNPERRKDAERFLDEAEVNGNNGI